MPTTTNPGAPLYGDYRDFGLGGRYGPTGENAPVQTGVEGGRNQFDYWETNPDKVNAYLQANRDDPKIRAAAERGSEALDNELHSRGIRVPEHYKAGYGPGGEVQVQPMNYWDKHKHWIIPAAIVGGAAAAPFAAGALGGGGGTAAGGAGAATGGAGGAGAAGAILPSTQIGTGFVPAIAGGSTILGSAAGGGAAAAGAGAAGGGAAGGGAEGAAGAAGSYLSRNRDTILGLSNIGAGFLAGLGDDDAGLEEYRKSQLQLDRDKFALTAPETRLDTSMHASRILNHEPVKAHWGGPGSGLRGETVRFAGGSANPNLIDQRTRDLSDDVLNQQLQDQMERDDDLDPTQPVPARRRLPAPGSIPPSDVAIPRRY